ncbi:MAG TPA: T9SS type A sorting domain-containing protein, partial [Chitinophagaceae bacterium]|jgi:hypothetical protein|nr:T9SS type A sorting domain-containing protein [Chitinophagaceae bacterium]
VEYSTDGRTWNKLGASGFTTNGYNKATQKVWSVQDYTRWHVSTLPLPAGADRLRLRFVMQSDIAINAEGIAVDDIHIYDSTAGIYTGPTLAAPVTENVSGTGWVDFRKDGQLIASLQPGGQHLGSTEVQAYIHTGAVRHTPQQYYHNRNITIKPAAPGTADSVTVRFYFLDAETDSLIAATGCAGCGKPSGVHQLGISKYSDPVDQYENGTVIDDNQGAWLFLTPAQVTKVPFDRGYYAEFRVKNFSEFWLNNGGLTGSGALPVKIVDFAARSAGGDRVVVSWQAVAEEDISRYEVEVARGAAELEAGRFSQAGVVESKGNGAQNGYSFNDEESPRSGTYFYRLKIVEADGSFRYSEVRSVQFSGAVRWQVYPNPSDGRFQLVYQLPGGETAVAQVADALGRTVLELRVTGTGSVQKLAVDLSAPRFAPGTYLLQLGGQAFKLYKTR